MCDPEQDACNLYGLVQLDDGDTALVNLGWFDDFQADQKKFEEQAKKGLDKASQDIKQAGDKVSHDVKEGVHKVDCTLKGIFGNGCEDEQKKKQEEEARKKAEEEKKKKEEEDKKKKEEEDKKKQEEQAKNKNHTKIIVHHVNATQEPKKNETSTEVKKDDQKKDKDDSSFWSWLNDYSEDKDEKSKKDDQNEEHKKKTYKKVTIIRKHKKHAGQPHIRRKIIHKFKFKNDNSVIGQINKVGRDVARIYHRLNDKTIDQIGDAIVRGFGQLVETIRPLFEHEKS